MTWWMVAALIVGDALLYAISALGMKRDKAIDRKYWEDKYSENKQWEIDRDIRELERIKEFQKYRAKQDEFNREIMQHLVERVSKVEDVVLKKEKKK